MTIEAFGQTAGGETVHRVTISGGGLTAKIMTWGATLQDLRLEGHAAPLTLGFPDFESYPLHRMPGMNALLRRALRRARAVTCVSEPLAEKVRDEYAVTAAVETIGNAVPDGLFIPQDKSACRRRLGLPDDACIIGTAGAISATRGLGALLDAFRVLRQSRSDLHLVLAGPDDGSLPVPVDDAHVHRLGSLPPADVPYVVGAMDLSVVCNADSAFGRYCFPQKLYESLACRVPVVVADVGAMSRLLSEHREVLFSPEDAEGLARLVEQRLRDPVVPDLPVPTWDTEGARLLAVMQRALKV